jgi:hypothetical protein
MTPHAARLRLADALARCDKPLERLLGAEEDLVQLGPMNAARLSTPTKLEADRVDLRRRVAMHSLRAAS